MIGLPNNWYVDFLGKAWSEKPKPPETFNCAELVRYCYLKYYGLEMVPIPQKVNAKSRLQCSKLMVPQYYDLVPIDRNVEDLDVCFMGKYHFMHCGVACFIKHTLHILHCPESSIGVCINTPLELRIIGFPVIKWYRHKDLR